MRAVIKAAVMKAKAVGKKVAVLQKPAVMETETECAGKVVMNVAAVQKCAGMATEMECAEKVVENVVKCDPVSV